MLATQARLGMLGEARASLAALDDERANSGEIRNARAVICLAEGDPAGALGALANVLDRDGTGHRCRHGRRNPPAGRARPP
jgi:LuxR family transcriptional regulator, maltose regulon positive regulatory protein